MEAVGNPLKRPNCKRELRSNDLHIGVFTMFSSAVCLSSRSLCRHSQAVFLGFTIAASAALAQSTTNTQYSSSASNDLSQSSDQGSGVLSYHSQDSGQNSGGYGNGRYHQYPKYGEPGFHHLAIEAGAGFGAPLANTSKTETFGYNIKLGGGWDFQRR